MMQREEARAWAIRNIAEWSSYFGVSVPGFRFNRTSRGLYYSGRREVTVAHPERYTGRRTVEHSLVHEFAHHLADERNREERKAARERGVQWFNLPFNLPSEYAHHGPGFRKALLDVTTKFYGDPKQYAWHTEYKSIQSWARKRGLLPSKPISAWRIGNLIVPGPTVVRLSMNLATGELKEKTLNATPVRRAPFRADLAVSYYKSGMRIGQIAKELNGGRAHGHTCNLVRAALRADGVYGNQTPDKSI